MAAQRRRPGGRETHRPGDGDRPAAAPHLRVVTTETYPDWEAIYRDNVDRVYRLMFAKVGNRPDAEDLTAEVFTGALRPLRTTASVGEVRAYLLAGARTVLAGYWRRTLGRQITTLDEDRPPPGFEPPGVEPPDSAGSDDGEPTDGPVGPEVIRARRILDALPQRYRRILELRFLRACTVREAAAELGVTVGNAKVLQHRALRAAALADGGEV
jgi:RNA polymerase sigma-70 factor (ECF subfamily)